MITLLTFLILGASFIAFHALAPLDVVDKLYETLGRILVRTWRIVLGIVTLQTAEERQMRRRAHESMRAHQTRLIHKAMIGDPVGGYQDPMDVWWQEDLAATDSAIDRIQRELNREEWARQTIQGERAADLLPPLEVPTEGTVLNMVLVPKAPDDFWFDRTREIEARRIRQRW
jgi:hypothetical protein